MSQFKHTFKLAYVAGKHGQHKHTAQIEAKTFKEALATFEKWRAGTSMYICLVSITRVAPESPG